MIKLSAPENTLIKGHYPQLYSAFSNLVINAIRHNPQGCDIEVAAIATDKLLKITVSDNGVGIPSKHTPRLTERFYRADADRNSSTGGTGLGLAIVKHVLQHHKGTLEIRSTEGHGASFATRFALT